LLAVDRENYMSIRLPYDCGMKTYDRKEAALFLKCDPETVSERVAAGELPCATIGRAMVFMDETLEAYLRDQTRKRTDAIRAAIAAAATPVVRRRRGRPLPELPPV
jgi:hypothetical protein